MLVSDPIFGSVPLDALGPSRLAQTVHAKFPALLLALVHNQLESRRSKSPSRLLPRRSFRSGRHYAASIPQPLKPLQTPMSYAPVCAGPHRLGLPGLPRAPVSVGFLNGSVGSVSGLLDEPDTSFANRIS
jgi:hypothetical protein